MKIYIDVYKIAEKSESSFLHNEVCRKCANKFHKKGCYVEFDIHLSKYIHIKDGVSYYDDGSDENPEIMCSICNDYLISTQNPLKYSV